MLFPTLHRILSHPLNRHQPVRALGRFLRWQVAGRLFPHPVIVPWVGGVRMIMRRGLYSATGNYYTGLSEFETMAFLLHFLGADDLFVDVGANVGAFSLLASGVCGAESLAIEPVPELAAVLHDNLRLNKLEAKVKVIPVAAGQQEAEVRLTTDLSLQNHVLSAGEKAAGTITVAVKPLDALLGDRAPTLLKIDVEGYEMEVLRGAPATLGRPSLQAIIIEMMGLGGRYGYSDQMVHDLLLEAGFQPYRYDPWQRRLEQLETIPAGNGLYLREGKPQLEEIKERLRRAPAFAVFGKEV